MRQPDEIDYEAAMRLPNDMACADCVHCRRCCAMFGGTPDSNDCDFYPSRFQEKSA